MSHCLVVPHKSGTSDGYANVTISDQQPTSDIKSSEHVATQQTIDDEAHRVQTTEPLCRIGGSTDTTAGPRLNTVPGL